MKITNKKITELKPYEDNPRINDHAVEAVANSIKEFGFKVPCVIDKNGVIVAGHTRVKAAKKLGIKTVPCVIADDLTEEQVKAFRLADNKTAEIAEWDFDKLAGELVEIELDMADFGFNAPLLEGEEEFYSQKIEAPVYEPMREVPPDLGDLVDEKKAKELEEEIRMSAVPDDVKEFLLKASKRHLKFNYQEIAEFYVHADKATQELMEASALVIIDYEDAIKNGFVRLSEELKREADGDNV